MSWIEECPRPVRVAGGGPGSPKSLKAPMFVLNLVFFNPKFRFDALCARISIAALFLVRHADSRRGRRPGPDHPGLQRHARWPFPTLPVSHDRSTKAGA